MTGVSCSYNSVSGGFMDCDTQLAGESFKLNSRSCRDSPLPRIISLWSSGGCWRAHN